MMGPALLVVTACAPTPARHVPTDAEALWARRAAELGRLDRWDFAGRIAVRSGEKGWNGAVRWSQAGERFEALITGPLGTGVGSLQGGPGGVLFRDAKGHELRSHDPDALLAEQLEVRLPVSGFPYWILGMPQPDRPYVKKLDGSGRLARLTQDGWQIEFQRYEPLDHLDLPARIELVHDDTRVRLVLDRWQIARAGTELEGVLARP